MVDITVTLNPDYEILLFKTLKAKKEEFAQFCMMAKARIGKDFKAEIKTGSKTQRSFPSPRSNSFLEDCSTKPIQELPDAPIKNGNSILSVQSF